MDALTEGMAAVSLKTDVGASSAVATSEPLSPTKTPKRQSAADLVPQLLKDLDNLMKGAPRIKLESVRTMTRYVQGLLHAWTPDQHHPDLPRVLAQWIWLLSNYRTLQADTAGSTAEYSLMTDIEITDCGYSDTIRSAFLSFKEFMESPQSINERRSVRESYLNLKSLWLHEGQVNSIRSKDLRARKQQVSNIKFRPDENPVLSQMLEERIRPLLPTKVEEERKAKVITDLENTVRSIAANARCHVFGSSANGFGFSTSDVDIALYAEDFLMAPGETNAKNDKDKQLAALRSSVSLDSLQNDKGFQERESLAEMPQEFLNMLRPEGLVVLRVADAVRKSGLFDTVETISSARVPVVKMIHTTTGLQCDLAVGNELAVHNTRLLKAYSELNPASTMMIMCVKLWAKKRGIGDASNGFLSSYAWTLLALFYLQRIPAKWNSGGPTIPNLQTCDGNADVDCVVDDFRIRYARKPGSGMERYSANASVGSLLKGFFAFYGGILSYQNDSIAFNNEDATKHHHGNVINKVELAIPKKPKNVMRWRFSIIDPFELSHDLGTTLSGRRAQIVINEEIWRAYTLLSSLPSTNAPPQLVQAALDQLFSDKDLVKVGGRLCMTCGETGHRTRNCPTFSTMFGAVVDEEADEGEQAEAEDGAETAAAPSAANQHKRKCYRCGAADHVAKNCPTMEAVKAAERKQDRAKRERDAARQHQSKAADKPSVTAAVGAPRQNKAEKKEAIVAEKKEASAAEKTPKPCFKCGQVGHSARHCPQQAASQLEKPCFKCGEVGHQAKHCPSVSEQATVVAPTAPTEAVTHQKKGEKHAGAEKPCFKCGQVGHQARACPNGTFAAEEVKKHGAGEAKTEKAAVVQAKKEMKTAPASKKEKASGKGPIVTTATTADVKSAPANSQQQPRKSLHTAAAPVPSHPATDGSGREASKAKAKVEQPKQPKLKKEAGEAVKATKKKTDRHAVNEDEPGEAPHPPIVEGDGSTSPRLYVAGAHKYSFQELQQKSLEQKLVRSGVSPLQAAAVVAPPPPMPSLTSLEAFPPLSLPGPANPPSVDQESDNAPPKFKLPPPDKW